MWFNFIKISLTIATLASSPAHAAGPVDNPYAPPPVVSEEEPNCGLIQAFTITNEVLGEMRDQGSRLFYLAFDAKSPLHRKQYRRQAPGKVDLNIVVLSGNLKSKDVQELERDMKQTREKAEIAQLIPSRVQRDLREEYRDLASVLLTGSPLALVVGLFQLGILTHAEALGLWSFKDQPLIVTLAGVTGLMAVAAAKMSFNGFLAYRRKFKEIESGPISERYVLNTRDVANTLIKLPDQTDPKMIGNQNLYVFFFDPNISGRDLANQGDSLFRYPQLILEMKERGLVEVPQQ